jgi:hypothetical protein
MHSVLIFLSKGPLSNKNVCSTNFPQIIFGNFPQSKKIAKAIWKKIEITIFGHTVIIVTPLAELTLA